MTTAKGQYQVSSEAITSSEPHNIITSFKNNEISLSVDTVTVTAPTESFLIYRYPDRFSFTDSTEIRLTDVQLRKTGSHLVNNTIDSLKLAHDTGFRIDIKLDKTSVNGQLIHFNSDAQNLTLNDNNQITYAITTDQGTYSLSSEPLSINSWTTIAGKYHNGELTLEVNGTAQYISASGSIQYDDVDQLKIGHCNPPEK